MLFRSLCSIHSCRHLCCYGRFCSIYLCRTFIKFRCSSNLGKTGTECRICPDCCFGTTETGLTYSRAGSSQLSSSSGYLIRKFDNTSIPVNFRTGNNYTCAPVYWLSVIYCDYAEAKAELGQLTDAILDNTLNKLFARAGLPNQTVASMTAMADPANNMGVSSLIWEVRRCRRCETDRKSTRLNSSHWS